jgi:hypothetical protein
MDMDQIQHLTPRQSSETLSGAIQMPLGFEIVNNHYVSIGFGAKATAYLEISRRQNTRKVLPDWKVRYNFCHNSAP